MPLTTVVFLGPSLDHESANRVIAARFLPPVARGDIELLLAETPRPRTIGIVDGRFLQSLCISPKEVLRAIDEGVTVFGASSMGALRAVECAPYGMIGVGQIYAEYALGRVDADDEVAIGYDEETGRPLSEPLINWRLAMAAGVRSGAVTAELADRFLAVAKQLYFPQRTVEAVLRLLATEVDAAACAELARYLNEQAPDAKRDDALAMLRQIRDRHASNSGL